MVSLFSVLVFDGYEILGAIIGLNIAFHMAFIFMSRVPYEMLKNIEFHNQLFGRKIYKFLKLFSATVIFSSSINLLIFTFTVINRMNIEQLLALPIFIGLLLGGLRLRHDLIEHKLQKI